MLKTLTVGESIFMKYDYHCEKCANITSFKFHGLPNKGIEID
ncbi:hypothetical protein CLCAR_0118 [Clostridium carboxidivorans P7]|nr:hypothetical protein CLCAR_0118 [Clostridium carboxidivorans P7]